MIWLREAMAQGYGETALRLAAVLGVFLAMAALELLRPRRKLTASKTRRWLTNLSIVGLDSLLVRAMANLAVPIAAVAAAVACERQGWGLFNALDWPQWIELPAAIVALDFALWLQHLLSHRIGLLWRLHQMHHSDVDIDVTTAIRFHPLEIALSMLWKIAWVAAMGPSPLAVVAFEILLNACAMFNHANVALPGRLDRALRILVVTPDMHRVHHSVLRREHDSNYGFNLSIWDRVFGTYRAEPERGHEGMTIGLSPYQAPAPTFIGWCLSLPFRTQPPRS